MFGIGPPGELPRHLNHMPLAMGTKVSTLLLTGDIHVKDARALATVARMIDDAELEHIAAHAPAHVEVYVISGAGHAVLSDQPDAALDALADFIAECVDGPAKT